MLDRKMSTRKIVTRKVVTRKVVIRCRGRPPKRSEAMKAVEGRVTPVRGVTISAESSDCAERSDFTSEDFVPDLSHGGIHRGQATNDTDITRVGGNG